MPTPTLARVPVVRPLSRPPPVAAPALEAMGRAAVPATEDNREAVPTDRGAAAVAAVVAPVNKPAASAPAAVVANPEPSAVAAGIAEAATAVPAVAAAVPTPAAVAPASAANAEPAKSSPMPKSKPISLSYCRAYQAVLWSRYTYCEHSTAGFRQSGPAVFVW